MRTRKKFDIQEQTLEFAVRVVRLVKRLPRTSAGFEFGRQVVRSAAPAGSDVEEADAGGPGHDFIHKMNVAHTDGRATGYWLLVVQEALLDHGNGEVRARIRQGDELGAFCIPS